MSGFFHALMVLRVYHRHLALVLSKRDCPVMSGFFHALLDALEESLNDVLDSIPTVVIAQLCRAFFMHNCINFGINNGVNKNHLIFVLLMSVFYYSSFSFTFE